MLVTERLDRRLVRALEGRGYRRRGGRRFVGRTYVVEMLPAAAEDRVTVFIGRAAAGDATRLLDCTRVTLATEDDFDRFVRRL